MRFIRYYSKLLVAQGMPHLSIEQHKRLFNIISVESRLDELYSLKKQETKPEFRYKYEVRIHTLERSLKTLTNDAYPKDVMENMLWQSEN